VIYCDSSFLVSLYASRDTFHAEARTIAGGFSEPIGLTLLSELELLNGIHRNPAIPLMERDAIMRELGNDEADGLLVRRLLDQADHYAKARMLSRRFSAQLSTRTLDILQVAAALLLGATEFASFDEKQRLLAKEVGLKLVPSQFPNKKPTKT
jgi:predicted nucleic acid-binding protein